MNAHVRRIGRGALIVLLGLAPLGSPCSGETEETANGDIIFRTETTISDIDAKVLSDSIQLQCGNSDFKGCTTNASLGDGVKCPRLTAQPRGHLDCKGTASGSIRATVPFAAEAEGEATFSFDAKFDYDSVSHTHETTTGEVRCDDPFLTDKGTFGGKLSVKLEGSTNSLIHGKAAGTKLELEIKDRTLCRFSSHTGEESLRCTAAESKAFLDERRELGGGG